MGCLASGAAAEEKTLTLDELLAQFGWDFDTVEVTSEKLGNGFYVLFGLGGNIAVSIGEQGVLIVDDQFPELMPKIEAEIEKLGGDGVDFAINTHWHFDHAQGNLALGPKGTWMVSHSNARSSMAKGGQIDLVAMKYQQAPYPEDALPIVTYDERMQLHWNGERVDLIHAGPAHTTGDTAIYFRGQDAIHMGDVFNNTGYPFIDAGSGGEIDGMIAFCRAILDEIGPETRVIPGHGAVSDRKRLVAYVDMLQTVRDRVAKLLADGKSIEEVIAANPAASFGNEFGDVSKSLGFIDRVYHSLKWKQP
jgi:glyoxylase-like metal-dependent hydrolase (beta-lactamase superfamily II)